MENVRVFHYFYCFSLRAIERMRGDENERELAKKQQKRRGLARHLKVYKVAFQSEHSLENQPSPIQRHLSVALLFQYFNSNSIESTQSILGIAEHCGTFQSALRGITGN